MATITGTDGNDGIYGTASADTIGGGLGDDTITGGGGDDSVEGGGGDDLLQMLYASDGNDTLLGGLGNDRISVHLQIPLGTQYAQVDGGDGDDTISASGVALAMTSPAQDAVIATGGAGQDTYISNGFSGLTITDFAAGVGGDSIELAILLHDTNITGRGYDGGNPFAAGNGFVRLVQIGPDTLLEYDQDGAAGGMYGWHTAVKLRNVDMGALTAENFLGLAPDGSGIVGQVLNGTAAADFLQGGLFEDTIIGGEGNDALYGGGDADWIEGGDEVGGGDNVSGGAGADTLMGGAGNDTLDAGAGDDSVEGGDGDDLLVGDGFDTLAGGSGDDRILIWPLDPLRTQAVLVDGGAGDDVITLTVMGSVAENAVTATGGTGRDTYGFNLASASGRTLTGLTITDFEAGDGGDRIAIMDALLNYRMFQGGDYEGGNPFGADQGYLRIVQDGSDTLLEYDEDGAGGTVHDWHTAVVLRNVEASTLTMDNFLGIAPDGSPIVGHDLVGTELSDQLEGWLGNDTLRGAAGNDSLLGSAGADLLVAGDGDDWVRGELGHDTLLGGAGDDELDGGSGDDSVDGGAGDDVLWCVGQGDDTLAGGLGADRFMLSLYSSTTQSPSVRVRGGGGDDHFLVGVDLGGTLLARGGTGRDTYALAEGALSGTMSTGVTVTDFEAGAGGDLLDLSALLNHSAMHGGFAGGQTSGYLRFVQSGTDTLLQHDVDGAAGTHSGWQTVIHFMGVAPSDITTENFVSVTRTGTDESERFLGGLGRDTFSGAGGSDTLDGGLGADWMAGGSGSDTYIVLDSDDVVEELLNEGLDTVVASVDWALGANQDHLVLDGTAIRGTGNELVNYITGNGADNVLDGLGGADVLIGGAGNDKYRVDDRFDWVVESDGSGIDLVVSTAETYILGTGVENGRIAGSGNAILFGNSLANVLHGGAGDDQLEGGAGADILAGGRGRDVLMGGAGSDVFDFDAVSVSTLAEAQRDRIGDFGVGGSSDRIDLSDIDAISRTGADDAFTFIGSSAFDGKSAAGQLRYEYDAATGMGILCGSTDADSEAEFAIELAGVSALVAADFVL